MSTGKKKGPGRTSYDRGLSPIHKPNDHRMISAAIVVKTSTIFFQLSTARRSVVNT